MVLAVTIYNCRDPRRVRKKRWSPGRICITRRQQKAYIEDGRPEPRSFPIDQDHLFRCCANRVARMAIIVDHHLWQILTQANAM